MNVYICIDIDVDLDIDISPSLSCMRSSNYVGDLMS